MQNRHKGLVPLAPKSLGDHLKSKRLARKLNQKQVAAIIGVSISVVSFWEANFYAPPAWWWERVISFLGYDPEVAELETQQQGGAD